MCPRVCFLENGADRMTTLLLQFKAPRVSGLSVLSVNDGEARKSSAPRRFSPAILLSLATRAYQCTTTTPQMFY